MLPRHPATERTGDGPLVSPPPAPAIASQAPPPIPASPAERLPKPPPLPDWARSKSTGAAFQSPKQPTPRYPARHGLQPTPALPGYEAGREKKSVVYQLAAALMLAAGLSTLPAVLDVIDHFRVARSAGVAPWALLLLLIACVQMAYALYLAQLPDWSTLWVASLLTLSVATLYAMLLGVFLLADANNQLIQLLKLDTQLQGHRAAAWCLLMLTVFCLLAYAQGRFSVRWHAAYRAQVSAGLPQGDRK
jgi:hypothetical protein